MENDLWGKCSVIAKSGKIDMVSHLLKDEVVARLSKAIDPNIDIEQLIISTYNPSSKYSLKEFIGSLIDLLNNANVKAKPTK